MYKCWVSWYMHACNPKAGKVKKRGPAHLAQLAGSRPMRNCLKGGARVLKVTLEAVLQSL